MDKQFRELEKSFSRLKDQFKKGNISREEYINQLKKLRVKDEEGRFWMIGAQSGKWYYYDGREWVQSTPPSVQEGKAICIYCGFENELTAQVCARCGGNVRYGKMSVCPVCGYPLDDPSEECPHCRAEERGEREEHRRQETFGDLREEERGKEESLFYTFRSISPFSLSGFCGFIGLILGIIFGAFVGASDYFSGVVKIMPSFLRAVHGQLFGGILFAGIGGLVGFIGLGLVGLLEAFMVNIISSLVGGVRIKFIKG